MGWTERQQQMLRAMGLRVWAPADGPVTAPPEENSAATAESVLAVTEAEPARSAPPRTTPPSTRPPPAPTEAAAPAPAPAAIDPAVASLDWPALREAVAACRGCTLCETRTQTVFGVGHEQAHWMIVGEAPGEQEDKQGEPFVGPAGQLLDAMLRAVGRSRSEGDAAARVYIANTLKCRPPRNRNPEPEELARCEAFLQRQIELVQPKLILAMGKFAIQQLTGSADPVGRLRGRVHRYQGVPVVVTYHPAYLLRQLTEKAKAWDDLRLAMRVYDKVLAREAG